MTVYEFLLHAARSYSGVVNGGKTEEIRIDLTRKSIWSGRLPISSSAPFPTGMSG